MYCKKLITTLVFEKNAIFSQKIVIIASTPGVKTEQILVSLFWSKKVAI
jgi:hypothetical protein